MPQATSISLSKFTAAVQAAVKAAVEKNPKFNVAVPNGVTVSYLIRGIPLPDVLLSSLTLSETQAFADDVAAHLGSVQPEIFSLAEGGSGGTPKGAFLSVGRHVVCGIPPFSKPMQIEK
jgi:hypothetical protein